MASDPQTRAAIAALLPRLKRFALALTGARDGADDLVQAAVERALNRLHQWQPGTRLDSWMFRIVQTVWSNELRARRVRAHEGMDAAAGVVGDQGERIAETRLTLRRVEAEFARLSPEQREAILLVCVEGYTHREAAEILDIPVGTVISRLARGRSALMERVEPRPTDGGNVVTLRRGHDADR